MQASDSGDNNQYANDDQQSQPAQKSKQLQLQQATQDCSHYMSADMYDPVASEEDLMPSSSSSSTNNRLAGVEKSDANNNIDNNNSISKNNSIANGNGASIRTNNVMHVDDDEIDDLRYDNASVERALDLQAATASSVSNRPQVNATTSNFITSVNVNMNNTVSISTTSPKAKSAPATPCNITPTAFHQHNPYEDSTSNNLANTLPPDIRRNISATCARVLPSSLDVTNNVLQLNGGPSSDKVASHVDSQTLDQLNARGELAMREKDYQTAIRLFSQFLKLASASENVAYLKKNFKVYSRRAEAHFKLANYHEAIDDSMAARELNPKWAQAYYLQGKSQFMIGQHADSLAVFAFGLTQEPTNRNLFEALVEAAINYSARNFKQEFEPKLSKLKMLKLDRRPFIVVSVLGQELLANGLSQHAAIVLESALKIGYSLEIPNSTSASPLVPSAKNGDLAQTTNMMATSGENTSSQQRRFRSSVISTIALAYCTMKDYDKAISYMLKELDIEAELEDVAGQCRVLNNLGYAYYKTQQFNRSLEAHRKQLNMAMKTHLFAQASQALNAIGHVHVARNDYRNALTSHTRCLDILKQLGDNHYKQFKELLSIGYMHAMMNDLGAAKDHYDEAVELIKCCQSNKSISHEEFTTGSIMVNFNLAYIALKRHDYHEARKCYQLVLKQCQTLSNSYKAHLYEMRAAHGMGQTLRLLKHYSEAGEWFEKQLQLAESLDSQLGQSQALCNLGLINQHYKDYQKAWQLFKDNLKLVENDSLMKAYAHSYLASTYLLMGHHQEANVHYDTCLDLSKDMEFCSSDQKTIEMNRASIQERPPHPEMIVHPMLTTALEGNNIAAQSNQAPQSSTHTKKVMIPS